MLFKLKTVPLSLPSPSSSGDVSRKRGGLGFTLVPKEQNVIFSNEILYCWHEKCF